MNLVSLAQVCALFAFQAKTLTAKVCFNVYRERSEKLTYFKLLGLLVSLFTVDLKGFKSLSHEQMVHTERTKYSCYIMP